MNIYDFWNQQAEWSEATFGKERGPIGPMKHLRKEVDEVLEHLEAGNYEPMKLLEEFADCLFLLFDAVRRAGFGIYQLVIAAFWKLDKNKKRVWPKPTSDDQPIEHVRGIHD